MPSRKRQPIELTTTSTMLYESVDNYHPIGLEDNSVRMNNHEDLNDFSSQSIVCAMDRFVKAVNNMNDTIMVPCRLLDIEVGSQKTTTNKLPKLLKSGGDPYSYYSILNSVKNDLIWGATSNDEDTTNDTRSTGPSINSTRWTGEESHSSTKKEPLRRQSTMSLASESSNTSTEGDSEVCSDSNEEDDRSTEGEETNAATVAANEVTESLRTHLLGLHSCLKNLTDTASYITECYQEVVNI